MTNPKIRKWQTVDIVKNDDYKIFSVETVRRTSPRTDSTHDFFRLQTSDWLNIIAVTAEQEIVFIEQYRHGADEVQLEIPGGAVDPGEKPEVAALRELAEETGFIGTQAIEIGQVNPNPGLFSNKCYTFLISDIIPGSQALEDTEDIAVRLIPQSEIESLISSGTVPHGLVVAAFYFYNIHARKGQ
jgi:ADP-ribose pyrophosphatase